jgi:flagellar hook-associated protein 2
LNLAGEASAVGAENTINGTYERKIAFLATDTLTQITTKINAANAGVTASIVNDGSGTAPFRLNLVASASGAAGRYLVNTGGFDFGLATTQTGQDARVFFGSADAANALLLSSSTNSLDNAISGVKVDLIATNASPATVTISRDTTAIEDQLTDFVKAFNELTARVGNQTSYDIESKRAGPLLGDSTALALRQALYTTIQSRAEGVSSQYARLTDIGFKVGTGGVLELNKDKLRGAIANDPEGVEQLLLARVQSSTTTRDLGGGVTVVDPDATVTFSSLGVLGQMEELATRYVDSVKGIIVGKTKSIEEQIKSQTRAIEQIDKRLASRRAVLEKQFLRMERSIGRLQGQSSSLQSISSLR